MSQPAAAPKKGRKSRNKMDATPAPFVPSEVADTPAPKPTMPKPTTRKAKGTASTGKISTGKISTGGMASTKPATTKTAPNKAAAPAAKREQGKQQAATAAYKAKSGPLGRSAPRPAYASGPSHSDFVGLAVLAAVVALAVTLFWLTGQRGLGAVGSSLPWQAAA